MAKKTVKESVGGKKLEIINAAKDCFMELGYEGTSIREIMRRADAEVGLFYYYFDSKDDVFSKVMDYISEKRKEKFENAYRSTRRDPFRALNRFLKILEDSISSFRKNESTKLHKTTVWATTERILEEAEPYVYKILKHGIEKGMSSPVPVELLATVLTHGIGSLVTTHENGWMDEGNRRRDIGRAYGLMLGFPPDQIDLMFPEYAEETDLEEIRRLIVANKNYFPALREDRLEEMLAARIAQNEIMVIKSEDDIAGFIIFSIKEEKIDYIFTTDIYRGKRVATRLLITALSDYVEGTEIELIIYKDKEKRHPAVERLLRLVRFGPKADIKLRGEPFLCEVWGGIAADAPSEESMSA